MKKILYLIATLFITIGTTACSGSSKSDENDSANDSAKLAQEAKAKEPSLLDSLPLDSIAGPTKGKTYWNEPSEAAGDFDTMLTEYETAVKQYQQYIKSAKGNYSQQAAYTKKCNKLYKKLEKTMKQLSAAQKKKLSAIKAKYDQAYNSING